MIHNHIRLSDGRKLGFAEFGDPMGKPVFYFHGFPGSRPQAKGDVLELANALGIDRFSILGVSGGGPCAAACACRIPQFLKAVGIVCGMGPVDAPGLIQNMPRMYCGDLHLAARLSAIFAALHAFSTLFFRHYPERMLSSVSG
jgi:pimeloyl-ACP methyl ester carboxylesterase